jgi:hypothetical protein
VYGRAVEIRDLEMRRRYSEGLYRKMGWKPEEMEYHLFSVDIESVAFVAFGDGRQTDRVWRRDQGGGAAGGG